MDPGREAEHAATIAAAVDAATMRAADVDGEYELALLLRLNEMPNEALMALVSRVSELDGVGDVGILVLGVDPDEGDPA